MNKSKILRAVLTAVLSLVATAASAHEFEVDGIYYNKNGDGTVSVTYQGSSYDEYADEYTGDVTIPSSVTYSGTTYSVTSIGSRAFYICGGLTSVSIPNSVTSIGDEAFFWCSGLTSVSIPDSVNSIGYYAFSGCSGLESIVVESGNSSYDSRDNCNAIIETATNTLLAGCKNTTIPNSVTSIGYGAFDRCSGLRSVTIPNSVNSIDDEAFHFCSGLTSINIPNSVTSIGYGAFKSCSGLTSVTIPNSVKSIGNDAFAYCSGLTSVSIPNSVTSIGGWAFDRCSGLRSVTIGNSVTSIGSYAFANCSGLTSVSIPNSVTSIGNEAFSRCSGLRSVTIGNSVTYIGDYAFAYCSGLTSITIPNSVTSIGDWAFEDCRGLTRVDISSIEAWLGIKFDGYDSNPLDYAQHLYLNGEEVKDLVIPNSVTSIGDFAFSGCSGLTSITIPNSVTSIGRNAFRDCIGLTSVISKAVTPPTCGDGVFSTETYSVPLIVPSIAKEAYKAASTWSDFSNYAEPESKITAIAINNNEANLVIGNTLQLSATVSPEDATFADVLQWSSSNPEVATVDDNGLVTAIAKGDAEIIATTCDGSNLSASYTIKVEGPNNEALAALNALVANAETLYNNSVEGDNIGDYTPGARAELFASIESVKSKISESMSADEITACTNEINAAIQLFESKKVTTAASALSFEVDGIYYNTNGDGTVSVTYRGSSYDEYANEYTGDVTIPSSVTYSGTTYSVTSIGSRAFSDCIGLTSVSIPNSVNSIGNTAFYECSGLTRVDISSIEVWLRIKFADSYSNPLYYARHLYLNGEEVKDLVIPNSATSIGGYAFEGCSGLTSVTIPNSVKSIGESAFYDCSGLTSVTIPNSVTSIGDYAFYFSGLTSVTIPNSVTSIGAWAFRICSGLTSVTIPNSVTSIGYWAFEGCSGLKSIVVESGNSTYDSRDNCNAIIETATNTLLAGCNNTIIPNSVTSIGNRAFSGFSGLTSVTIPNSVTSIGNQAFYGCIGLTSVISKAVTPPTCGDGVFTAETYSVPLIVPSVAKEAYQAASIWSNFSNYVETDNKITAIAINNNEANLVIGNTLQLSATVSPEDATFADVLQWTSSNPEVATVDDNGLVTAIAKGDAEIIATTCDGSNLSTSCIIKVLESNDEALAALNALVANAETLYNNSVEGDNIGDYTPGARAELFASIESVKSKISESMSADEITACTNEINAAIQLFESKKVTTAASALSFEVDGIYYNTNGDGTVSVTFKGSHSGEYTNEYTGDVVIPSSVTYSGTTYSVTSIGEYAFYDCNGLTSVSIPNSATSIGGYAFSYCIGLTRVDISSLEAWSGIKFENHYSNPLYYAHHLYLNGEEVEDLVIPNSVTAIGDYAFYCCSGLTSVTIPNSATSIGNSAFDGCSGLESIVVESGNSTYDSRDNCNAIIETATNSLLAGCKNTTIPNSVTSIGDYAFRECSGLTSVTIPNSVTSIGNETFSGCSGLTSVTIPNYVTFIGGAAFSYCSGLESIVVESGNFKYDSRDNCNAIIETATNTLLAGCKNTTIPNSVTSIGYSAFSGCSGLTSVTIPNSVSSIGDFAFSGCSGLTSVTIPNSVTSIGNDAFYRCSGLTSVTIGNSVTSIGNTAFYGCSGLTSVTIGNSVTSIGVLAFYFCSRLTSVISKAVTPPTCGGSAFSTETYSVPLIVPSVAKEAYQAASIWSNFSNYAEPESKITNASFNYNESYVVIGNTLQLNVKVTPEDATFADVLQWTSSNPEVATVDDNGLVTAIAKGDSEIIATTCDGSNLSTSCIIKVRESNDEALATLNALVAKAETLYKNSVEGDRIGDYTPGARAELFASIESVKSKISESMSADEINACTNEINAAIQLFESKMVTTGEDTDVSLHENIIFIENAEAFVGKSVTLSLKMNNTIVPVGFQCDFYAPSKTSVPTDEDGFYAIDLSTERTTTSRTNIFTTGLQKDGGIRILAASMSNYPFMGNEGEVVTITLNVDAELEEGEYPLILRNVIISDAQSNTYSVDYVKSTLTVSNYTPGDVNGDGSINIGDVTAVVSHIMGAETNVFIEKAADVTGDGNVNIGDLTGIVGMIIGGNSLAPATKAATKAIASPKTSDISGYDNVIYPKDVTFGENGRATLSINMKNSVVTPGFQFDIVMPEGIEIESEEIAPGNIAYYIDLSIARTTTRKTDIFTSGLQEDGSVRVLAASTKNIPFEGNDGEVCTVSLILGEGTAPGEYEVVLKNIIISDPKGVTYTVDKTTAIITVPGSINEAANVNELVSGANNVGFGLQGVKMHDGVLYACTTAESVNKSTPTLHGNDANNMAPYEDRNFADFDQRDWVAISGLVDGFVGKELSYPFVATFAEGVLTPSETINTKADATAYTLNTFRAENILHGGYSNYAESVYKAYYVPARVNEVAKFMGFIETVNGIKYLYSDNANGRKNGEGIKIEGNIADNLESYSLMEGILVADATTKAGVKIIMLQDLGKATGVEGVDTAAARIYSANGNIIIAATEDGEAAVYDFTGRLIKSVPVVAGDSTAVPVMPGCYIVKTGTKTQSVVVK